MLWKGCPRRYDGRWIRLVGCVRGKLVGREWGSIRNSELAGCHHHTIKFTLISEAEGGAAVQEVAERSFPGNREGSLGLEA